LDGIDIDVEEYTSIDVVTRLITQLKGDFGKDFIITLAPVASALTGGSNLSGFNYVQLEQTVGANISWYNAQFYSGFGSIFPEDQCKLPLSVSCSLLCSRCLDVRITNYANGLFPPNKVVASVLTNPSLGYGYVAPARVVESLQDLVALYGPSFGGVCGWEYFGELYAPTTETTPTDLLLQLHFQGTPARHGNGHKR
jgi:chitinase